LLIDRSANIFTTENFNLKVDFSDTFITPVTNTLFSDSVVTPGSAGQILKIEPNDAGFAEIAKLFNDGVNQAMRFVMTEKSSGRAEGRGYMQAPLFSKPTTAPDFAPKFIDKIELVINQFTLVFPLPGGAQPASTGKPVELSFTLNVYGGEIPEPTTAGLLGAAALAAVAVSRKRRG